MPSPFPGMNPWIERAEIWPDFHSAYIPALRRRLAGQILPKYIVLMEDQITVQTAPDEPVRAIRPDLSVARVQEGPRRRAPSVAQVDPPARLRLPTEEEERLPYLRILEREGRELVTVVELLSPSNKRRGESRGGYLQRRREVLGGRANLVEIDLLRGGPPMPLSDRPACDYSVLVSRSEARPVVDFWPINLRDPLPTIPIPLRPEDADARLDLQSALGEVYDEAGYAHFLYDGRPEPPLSAEDEAWSREVRAQA